MKEKDFAQKLGLMIKIERIKKDLHQSELACDAEIAQSHLSKIEKGTVNVSVIILMRIANILGCKASDLLVDLEE